jgi:hypothetical protein
MHACAQVHSAHLCQTQIRCLIKTHPTHAGHVPYMPKARVVYQALEVAVKPKQRNIVTTEDGDYWKAVRQGTAPCFSMTNLKKVSQHC